MERPDFELEELAFEDDNDEVSLIGLEDIFAGSDEKQEKKPERDKNERKKPQKAERPEELTMEQALRMARKAEKRKKEDTKPLTHNKKENSLPADPAGVRIDGKITKRVSGGSINPLINRKVDAIIEHMLKTGDIQIGKPAQRPAAAMSSSTMPLHAAAAGPVNYCLVDTATSQVVQIQGILRIGRDESFADLIPAGNATISSQHAQITEKGGIVLVRDLDSRNGTFINNERIAKGHNIEIDTGDIVKFSNAEYRLETI